MTGAQENFAELFCWIDLSADAQFRLYKDAIAQRDALQAKLDALTSDAVLHATTKAIMTVPMLLEDEDAGDLECAILDYLTDAKPGDSERWKIGIDWGDRIAKAALTAALAKAGEVANG